MNEITAVIAQILGWKRPEARSEEDADQEGEFDFAGLAAIPGMAVVRGVSSPVIDLDEMREQNRLAAERMAKRLAG